MVSLIRKLRVPRTALLFAAPLLVAGIAAACGEETANVNLLPLQYANSTAQTDLKVRVKVAGNTIGTYDLNPIGNSSTWTKINVSLPTGTVVETTVLNDAGATLATGICTASDAETLDYARVQIGPEVTCSCGFAEFPGPACAP